MCQCARAAITKCHEEGELNRNLLSHSAGGQESETTVSVRGAGSFRGRLRRGFSWLLGVAGNPGLTGASPRSLLSCSHGALPGVCRRSGFPFCKDGRRIASGPPISSMTSS